MKKWTLLVPLAVLNGLLIIWCGYGEEMQTAREVISCLQLFLTVIA